MIISPDGNIQLLPITGPAQSGTVDTVDKVTAFIERSPDILERIKRVFTSDKKKKGAEEEVVDNTTDTVGDSTDETSDAE